jgi:hypothetical protein
MFYDQETNLYYKTLGPPATMAYRPYPVSYPLQASCPLDWYAFAQENFTYGPVEDQNITEVWDLKGQQYDVYVVGGLLFHNGFPLQKQGVIATSLPQGYSGNIPFEGPFEIGPVLIDKVWYEIKDNAGKLDRPLDSEVLKDQPYLCFGSVYCYTEVNTSDLGLPFPGTFWSVRPVSYHPMLPKCVGAYADLQQNSWYVPIPFPKKTMVDDLQEPLANGYDMAKELSKIFYNRHLGRWGKTFPLPHRVQNSYKYSIVRTKPLIAKLRYNYRLAIKYDL